MDGNNKLAKVEAERSIEFTPTRENIELLKKTLVSDRVQLSDSELQLFLYRAQRTGLDPLARQIYVMKNKDRVTFMTSIDGQRLVAQRTGEYEGQTPTEWCGEDGIWKDVWLHKEPPMGARVGVWRTGFKEAVYGVARWDSYAKYVDEWTNGQKTGNKVLSPTWAQLPDVMLAKCAESLAFRRAFPQELANLYTPEEMDQSNSFHEDRPVAPKKLSAKDALVKANSFLTRKGFTADEKKSIIASIADSADLAHLSPKQLKDILEVTSSMSEAELRHTYLATEGQVIDPTLMEDDPDPDMPRDFLLQNFLLQNDAAEVTDDDLANLEDEMKKVKK